MYPVKTILATLLLGAMPFPQAIAAEFENISLETGHQLWEEGVFVLDVRTDREFTEGHLPGARHITVSELETRLGEIEEHKGEAVLVYCAVGGRSTTAAALLASNGFTEIKNMKPGFKGWAKADLEVETGPEKEADASQDAVGQETPEEETAAPAAGKASMAETDAAETSAEDATKPLFGCAAGTGAATLPLADVFLLILAAAVLLWGARRTRGGTPAG